MLPEQYNRTLQRCSKVESGVRVTLGCSTVAEVADDAAVVVWEALERVRRAYRLWHLCCWNNNKYLLPITD